MGSCNITELYLGWESGPIDTYFSTLDPICHTYGPNFPAFFKYLHIISIKLTPSKMTLAQNYQVWGQSASWMQLYPWQPQLMDFYILLSYYCLSEDHDGRQEPWIWLSVPKKLKSGSQGNALCCQDCVEEWQQISYIMYFDYIGLPVLLRILMLHFRLTFLQPGFPSFPISEQGFFEFCHMIILVLIHLFVVFSNIFGGKLTEKYFLKVLQRKA